VLVRPTLRKKWSVNSEIGALDDDWNFFYCFYRSWTRIFSGLGIWRSEVDTRAQYNSVRVQFCVVDCVHLSFERSRDFLETKRYRSINALNFSQYFREEVKECFYKRLFARPYWWRWYFTEATGRICTCQSLILLYSFYYNTKESAPRPPYLNFNAASFLNKKLFWDWNRASGECITSCEVYIHHNSALSQYR